MLHSELRFLLSLNKMTQNIVHNMKKSRAMLHCQYFYKEFLYSNLPAWILCLGLSVDNRDRGDLSKVSPGIQSLCQPVNKGKRDINKCTLREASAHT